MVQVHLLWVGMTLMLEAAHHAILRNLVSVLSGTGLLLSSVLGLLSDASLEGESVPPLQKQLREQPFTRDTAAQRYLLPNTWVKAELVCKENKN